ncbi:DNA polymerase IV [Aquimarina sp. ERC-38]|uniref:DNA polymerase IV n=1 Tax=Aquimarina sp. ERC-38 TaxID=2949996 RepID=UPI002245C423|nr:DNA polymerase IV [Aquimarina sp. ERC-38]UZO81348.1 DNA polymerase IV [Aquimarina sp. ERC-38]
MKTAILHFDLDTFFVSCERLMNSELVNKPVLVGGTGDRGVVAACSYETRPFGVHSGMSMRIAQQLCPEAVFVKGNSMSYMRYSEMVTQIIREAVPALERASVDEFYADLTGMDRFFGTYKFAKELRTKIIKETGLPISFGLSQNKTVSKVATGEAKPNNQIKIDEGFEKKFLAPLAIRKIPMVGKASAEILRNLGIHEVRLLQQMPVEMVESVLGKNGRTIWERANGIDNRPIVLFNDRKSISTERTYNLDTIDVVKLQATLIAMGEHLAYNLRRENKLTSCVAVKIRYSNFDTETKQVRIPYTSADHIILPKLQDLFAKLYNRRLLVRLIGIRFSNIVGGNYQINMFDDSTSKLNLYNALDTIKNRYGASAVIRASTLGVKTIRDRRNPFKDAPPILYAHRKQ